MTSENPYEAPKERSPARWGWFKYFRISRKCFGSWLAGLGGGLMLGGYITVGRSVPIELLWVGIVLGVIGGWISRRHRRRRSPPHF